MDGLYHVVRSFPKKEIIHAEGDVDPFRDMNIILEELIAKDIQFVQKSEQLVVKKRKTMSEFDYDSTMKTIE